MQSSRDEQHARNASVQPIGARVIEACEIAEGAAFCGEQVDERDLAGGCPCCAKRNVVGEMLGEYWRIYTKQCNDNDGCVCL